MPSLLCPHVSLAGRRDSFSVYKPMLRSSRHHYIVRYSIYLSTSQNDARCGSTPTPRMARCVHSTNPNSLPPTPQSLPKPTSQKEALSRLAPAPQAKPQHSHRATNAAQHNPRTDTDCSDHATKLQDSPPPQPPNGPASHFPEIPTLCAEWATCWYPSCSPKRTLSTPTSSTSQPCGPLTTAMDGRSRTTADSCSSASLARSSVAPSGTGWIRVLKKRVGCMSLLVLDWRFSVRRTLTGSFDIFR
jgi:hypothetical protein